MTYEICLDERSKLIINKRCFRFSLKDDKLNEMKSGNVSKKKRKRSKIKVIKRKITFDESDSQEKKKRKIRSDYCK